MALQPQRYSHAPEARRVRRAPPSSVYVTAMSPGVHGSTARPSGWLVSSPVPAQAT